MGEPGLAITTDFPCGNVADGTVSLTAGAVEATFAAHPHGGPECLWFYFRLTANAAHRERPLRLVLKHSANMLGANQSENVRPVVRTPDADWQRLPAGEARELPDGRFEVEWRTESVTDWTEVAFCYPYASGHVQELLSEVGGAWNADTVGISQAGRALARLSNDYGETDGDRPGLYLVGRQHSGETPGSWVLDGLLRAAAELGADAPLIWAVPLSNVDGVEQGDYGKDNFPYDLNRAWGQPPMRHETLVIQRDIERWRRRCRPVLAIDFHAPGGCEADGAYAYLPKPDRFPEQFAEVGKWTEAARKALGPELAAEVFSRTASYASRWETPTFTAYMSLLGIPAFTLETPYALANGTVMTREVYRELGRRLLEGAMTRLR